MCKSAFSKLESHSAASEVYRAGIQRKARPVERLKKKYDEFRRRTYSKPPIPPPAPQVTLPKANGTLEADSLRRQPLKNYENPRVTKQSHLSSAPSSHAPSASSSSTSHSHNRYAYMLAPPAAGRRPEKLRLNLKLLFTEEGEYSMPEARARSMGLLGKRWGPPPASELSRAKSSTMRVNFNDDGTKNTRNYTAQRSLAAGEPTVTINTKAALADVFGMYNSPEKSTRLSTIPGTKHAPVHAVERVRPINLLPQTRPASVENAGHSTAPPSEGQILFFANTLASLNSFQVLHLS
jgi:checkpoint serine/threonine-protein kinase